jgi:hypothetical protein
MLLPALARAKSRAFAANDINNCKQVMLSTAMYATDNADYLPAPGWQMNFDNWVTSANLAPLGVHTPATFDADLKQQLAYFDGKSAPSLGKPGLLYEYLKDPKIFICPEDRVDANFYKRYEIISSYVWNGAIVGYPPPSTTYVKPFKISRFKPTNILQWENDEKNTASGAWNDFSNYPLESGVHTFSLRHGKSAQIGRMDGSAARFPMPTMLDMANAALVTGPNDLWCNPNSPFGH